MIIIMASSGGSAIEFVWPRNMQMRWVPIPGHGAGGRGCGGGEWATFPLDVFAGQQRGISASKDLCSFKVGRNNSIPSNITAVIVHVSSGPCDPVAWCSRDLATTCPRWIFMRDTLPLHPDMANGDSPGAQELVLQNLSRKYAREIADSGAATIQTQFSYAACLSDSTFSDDLHTAVRLLTGGY